MVATIRRDGMRGSVWFLWRGEWSLSWLHQASRSMLRAGLRPSRSSVELAAPGVREEPKQKETAWNGTKMVYKEPVAQYSGQIYTIVAARFSARWPDGAAISCRCPAAPALLTVRQVAARAAL